MVVFVANEAWPTFKHNGLSWLGPGGNVDEQINKMVNSGANAPAEDYYVRAWPLVWGTILTTGLAVVFGLVFAILAAIFIVEFAPDRLRNVIVPVVPAPGGGAVGDLRPDRDPRPGALRGQPHHQPGRQGVGAVRRPAHGREPAGRRRDPHRDDRADHDRDHRRRALRRPARLEGGRGRPRRQPLARDVDRLGPRGAAGDHRRRGPRLRPRARRGHHVVDGRRARSASRRTRSTARACSCWSRCGRWPRRSWRTPRRCRRPRCAPWCTPSPCCCCSAACSCPWPASWPSSR